MNQALTFTLFPNLSGAQANEYTTTTNGMVEWLKKLGPYRDKAACPLISMNRYGERRSPKNSLRRDANILEATGVIGDYDAGEMPPDQAATLLRLVGIEVIIVTTPSHGIKGNRWRVVAPFAQARAITERHELLGKLNTVLGGVLAGESFTASQAFYAGRVDGVAYEVIYVPGIRLDVLSGVETLDFTGPPAAQPRVGSTDPLALIPKRADDLARLRAALALIPNEEPDWERWNRIGMAIYNASGGTDEGLEAWREWSDRCPGGGGDTVDARWQHYRGSPPTELGMGTLVHLAGGNDAIKAIMPPVVMPWQDAAAAVVRVDPPSDGTLADVDDEPPALELIPGGKGDKTLEAAVMVDRHLHVAFDEFKQRIVLLSPPPWKPRDKMPRNWSDVDTVELQMWMQSQMMKPSKDATADAVMSVAHRRPNHPVRNYLNPLEWDGVNRLDTWLPRYLGAPDTEYTRTIGPKFLISAVKRIYEPGCQADYMMVLEGSQGLQKSSVIRALVPDEEWFTDELPDVTSKDAAIQLNGTWILEVSEMDAMNRAESGATKKFTSRRVDKYRPPYGRTTVDVPRQCVFIGTVNPEAGVGYLKDQTGNRRFWPVPCGQCDIAGVVADRDQLWAEAKVRYLTGEKSFVDVETERRVIHPEQEVRRERHPWEDRIAEWLVASNITAVTTSLVASVLLKIPDDRMHSGTTRQIANALRKIGWTVSTKKQRVSGTSGPVVIFYRDADDPRIGDGHVVISIDQTDKSG